MGVALPLVCATTIGVRLVQFDLNNRGCDCVSVGFAVSKLKTLGGHAEDTDEKTFFFKFIFRP